MKILLLAFCLISPYVITGCTLHSSSEPDALALKRRNMVRFEIMAREITNQALLNAMIVVPRHLFLPEHQRFKAYNDEKIVISDILSAPQPFVIAKTIELLDLTGSEKVLEVGTGTGYQSAILSEMAKNVFTVEIVPRVAEQAKSLLVSLGYKNVSFKIGDGFQGWAEEAPFDAILVMASVASAPEPLLQQLATGGRMVVPEGTGDHQKLVLYRKMATGILREPIMETELKPMEGSSARALGN